jgi:hypothetical protein
VKKTNKSKTKTSNPLIGRYVIVRANVAGVHAGKLVHLEGTTAILEGAYRLWRVYTRDKSGSISDVAANGLKPNADHSIGARLNSVLIENPPGLEVAEMTEAAFETIEEYENK